MALKPAACILCGPSDSDVAFTGRDVQHGLPGTFSVHRCRRCGTFFLNPRPDAEDLQDYYPEDYTPYQFYKQKRQSIVNNWRLNYGIEKQVRAVLSRAPTPGRALDVGCATGAFLSGLRNYGWQVEGVEVDARAAAYARREANLQVFTGDLFEAAYADNSFDLVTFWDVLEHLPNPLETLEETRRITASSGLLVLSIPNPESLEARLFGPQWAGWDVPRHLWLSPRSALLQLLEKAGWDVEETICMRGRQWLLTLSLRFWLQERPLPSWLSHSILATVKSLPASALLWPYFAIVERLGLGSILVIFAHKSN